MKVIIVDDEQIGRESLQALLSMFDFEVFTASNGLQAIEIASRIDLDLALIDWMLADEMDGCGVADALRKIHPVIRIVIISGQLDVRARSSQDSDYGYLRKPFRLSELLAMIPGEHGASGDAPTM